jgi:DOPA 4,5-dioxygenase
MTDADPRYHAHIYFSESERPKADALRDRFLARRDGAGEVHILFVGPMRDGPVGPHPIPQYEIHFLKSSRDAVIAAIDATGLRALVHPLTDDDLADQTSLAHWLGEPLALDLSVLDPPGVNQGVPRFGKTDF